MNKRHYEHTLPNIRGSLSNTYEKKAAREAAIKKLQEEELAKLKKRQQAKRENNTEVQTQLTLF